MRANPEIIVRLPALRQDVRSGKRDDCGWLRGIAGGEWIAVLSRFDGRPGTAVGEER
jgi:hypothetical protein